MAEQYPKLVNKQYNSPIGLYSDQNVREILQSQTQVLSNGAVGIDFNNPMTNKPANLQNSAVLRMLEEEENRKRSGQPGSLKRVAWPPPEDSEEFIEQPAVQAQGGPINPQKTTTPGPKVYHIPIQQPSQQPLQQPIQQPLQQPTQEPTPQKPPTPQYKPEEPKVFTSSATFQPVSPTASTDFTNLAKPWSPQLSPASTQQFRSVSPSMSSNIQSYKSSKTTEYHTTKQYQYSTQTQSQTETQPVLQVYSTSSKETSFEHKPSFKEVPVFKPAPPPEFKQQILKEESQPSKLAEKILTVKIERADPEEEVEEKSKVKPATPKKEESKSFQQFSSSTQTYQEFTKPSQFAPQSYQEPTKPAQFVPQSYQEKTQFLPQTYQEPPKPIQFTPQSYQEPPKPTQFVPQQTVESPKIFSPAKTNVTPPQKVSSSDQLAPSQQGTPQPQRTFTKPKPVEPPPSTITLRPQAPVSQAPPPLVSSQPATAKFRGGKNLRGDLKWPPEEVKEKMEAEKQHLIEIAKGPACRPKKNCKDYTPFFAKHQLNNTYPGYKIPPGTQFYDHNPVM